jgi:hypothetical protein
MAKRNSTAIITLNVAATFVKFAIPPPIMSTFPAVGNNRHVTEL